MPVCDYNQGYYRCLKLKTKKCSWRNNLPSGGRKNSMTDELPNECSRRFNNSAIYNLLFENKKIWKSTPIFLFLFMHIFFLLDMAFAATSENLVFKKNSLLNMLPSSYQLYITWLWAAFLILTLLVWHNKRLSSLNIELKKQSDQLKKQASILDEQSAMLGQQLAQLQNQVIERNTILKNLSEKIKIITNLSFFENAKIDYSQIENSIFEDFERFSQHVYLAFDTIGDKMAWYKSIIDSIKNDVAIIDLNMNILYLNDSAQKSLDKSLSELMNTPYNACVDFPVEALRNGRESEVLFRESNGNYYKSTVSTLNNANGQRIGYIINTIDITDIKKAQAEAIEANRAKSDFLARMSHEIRTPMNGIIGFADMLLNMSIGMNPDQLECLSYIKTNANALSVLVNDVLDLSKIEAGKFEIDDIEFELNEIHAQIKHIARSGALKNRIDFFVECDSRINHKVTGDPNRLRQILINLVYNAIKFTPSGKKVILKTLLECETHEDITVKFMVCDEGIGIAGSKLDNIFNSFTQSDNTISRKYGGTGLGLTISNHLVKLMGGEKIFVESQEGVGSKFFFIIKFKKLVRITKNENIEPFLEKSKDALPVIRKKYRILLADDDMSNIALLSKSLSRQGHDVVIVENGQEAVEKASSESFDIILMDSQMPIMDGVEATRAIRGFNQRTPIIAVTASALKSDYEMCISAGMNGYITKPINVNNVYEILEKFINAVPVN